MEQFKIPHKMAVWFGRPANIVHISFNDDLYPLTERSVHGGLTKNKRTYLQLKWSQHPLLATVVACLCFSPAPS